MSLAQGSSQNLVKSRFRTPAPLHVYFQLPRFIRVAIVTHRGADENQILTFLSQDTLNTP